MINQETVDRILRVMNGGLSIDDVSLEELLAFKEYVVQCAEYRTIEDEVVSNNPLAVTPSTQLH